MNMLKALRQLNDALVRCLQLLLIVVFVVLVVDVLWGVASRYVLGNQASWSEELARLLLVWLALLGAALASREERHLGLDVIVREWPVEVQRIGGLFVCLLVLLFAAGIMAWGGGQLVWQRFASGQTLPALGIARAWFYMALPVSGILISLFAIESIWSTLVAADTGKQEEDAL